MDGMPGGVGSGFVVEDVLTEGFQSGAPAYPRRGGEKMSSMLASRL
jgi:hypothetical protein